MAVGESRNDTNDAGQSPPPEPLTVVGIGASAGGLDALKEFFRHVPAESGVAWVVVVHLSPEHESHLAQLLQTHSPIPVQQVVESTRLHPDRIYVIPPNANLNAVDTHLRLSDIEMPAGRRAPVDHFFRTLAQTFDGHSVGVILTGTGSDGSQGIREIRARGGLTLAQDPDDAEFDGMPRSAIATGDIDAVYPLAELASAVLRLAQTRPRLAVAGDDGTVPPTEAQTAERIFAIVRRHTGRDFSRYKRPTMFRRIGRRMQLHQLVELSDYLELLQADAEESRALAEDSLITVTSFFRDPEVFDAVAQDVIPRLFEGRGAEDAIRVWSVGCATGEEPYSLAMLLLEEAERHPESPRLQVFATDLHGNSLATARDGYYSEEIANDVRPDRLTRFFQREDGRYRVRKEVRDLVLFSSHDLIGDPPFSRIDFIACRNVLIYLQRRVQRDVLDLFHFCLAPDGYLVLGTSETTDGSQYFSPIDATHRLYRRRAFSRTGRIPMLTAGRGRAAGTATADESAEPVAPGLLHQRLVERFVPPSLIVGADDAVLHMSAHAGRYLVQPGGEPTTNIYQMVHETLRLELRVALHAARHAKGRTVSSNAVLVPVDGIDTPIVLRVRASAAPDDDANVLIVFDEPRPGEPMDLSRDAHPDQRIEADMAHAERRLHAIVADYESSQHELRAANEELQSSNEELRALLEELETGKEELQSVNEELQAVNEDNRHKVDELAQLSGDLQNLLVSTEVATLFLDRQMRIVRFTPKLAELFSILPGDRGRAISDLTHRLGYEKLVDDAKVVLDKLSVVEGEVEDHAGRWYLKRLLPYRSTSDRIEGVVVTFVDITARKALENELRAAKELAESIVETTSEPFLVLDEALCVQAASTAFLTQFAVSRDATVGAHLFEIDRCRWDIPELRTLLESALPAQRTSEGLEITRNVEGKGQRLITINARLLEEKGWILLGMRDITELRRREDRSTDARREAERVSRTKGQFLSTMSHEMRTPLNAMIGMTHVLEEGIAGPTTPEQKRLLGRINLAAWQLTGVIDDIMASARSEAGREQVTLADAEIVAQVQEVVQMLDSPAGSIAFAPSIAPVHALTDERKVRQIVTNLVGNALKHGVRPIEVTLAATEEWFEIAVRDRGPGIPREEFESIFQPFVQRDASTSRASGIGLGLTISRRHAALLGGSVSVASEPGEGSTFTLRLPRRSREVDAEPTEAR